MFETNIRFIGGFLAIYALTGDPMFREKALMVAERLLPAFDSPTGIPYALINVRSGVINFLFVFLWSGRKKSLVKKLLVGIISILLEKRHFGSLRPLLQEAFLFLIWREPFAKLARNTSGLVTLFFRSSKFSFTYQLFEAFNIT